MYWSIGNQFAIFSESNGASIIVRIAVAIEIPGRIDEGVHGVGFALAGAAALADTSRS